MEVISPPEKPSLPPLVSRDQLAVNSGGKIHPEDPRLADAAAGASEAVRRYCGWHVTPVIRETVTLDATGTLLKLPTMRVLNIEDVYLHGELLDEGDYSWSQMGVISFRVPVKRKYRAVTLTITHGYHEAPDLVQAASKAALFSLASPLGVTREQAGQISVSWGSQRGMGFDFRDTALMRPYKLQVMP